MSSTKRKVLSSLAIDAAPERVWETLGDAASWDRWNPMFGRFEGRFDVGAPIAFDIRLGRGTVRAEATVQRADAGELRWVGPRKAVQKPFAGADHFFRLEPLDHGRRTRLVHGETFRGALFALLWPHVRKMLPAAYDEVNAALKRDVEARG
ncbi:MAG: SRPBCC domain-containing protein [Myxococcota bacterium]